MSNDQKNNIIEQIYQKESREKTSQSIDYFILNEAKKSCQTRSIKHPKWLFGFASAAVSVLSIFFIFNIYRNNPELNHPILLDSNNIKPATHAASTSQNKNSTNPQSLTEKPLNPKQKARLQQSKKTSPRSEQTPMKTLESDTVETEMIEQLTLDDSVENKINQQSNNKDVSTIQGLQKSHHTLSEQLLQLETLIKNGHKQQAKSLLDKLTKQHSNYDFSHYKNIIISD